jgi:hypothetical protein
MALCRRIFASSVGAVLAVNLIQPFVFLLSCSPVKLLSDAFADCALLESVTNALLRFYSQQRVSGVHRNKRSPSMRRTIYDIMLKKIMQLNHGFFEFCSSKRFLNICTKTSSDV